MRPNRLCLQNLLSPWILEREKNILTTIFCQIVTNFHKIKKFQRQKIPDLKQSSEGDEWDFRHKTHITTSLEAWGFKLHGQISSQGLCFCKHFSPMEGILEVYMILQIIKIVRLFSYCEVLFSGKSYDLPGFGFWCRSTLPRVGTSSMGRSIFEASCSSTSGH